MSQDYYKAGTWKAICAVCGFQMKADELIKDWRGLYVCTQDFETRHILDFFKVIPDHQQVPWAQKEIDDQFGSSPGGGQPVPDNGYQKILINNTVVTIDKTVICVDFIESTPGAGQTVNLPLISSYSPFPIGGISFARRDTTGVGIAIQISGSNKFQPVAGLAGSTTIYFIPPGGSVEVQIVDSNTWQIIGRNNN